MPDKVIIMVNYPSEKFGNHVTGHRPPRRPSAPQAYQCKMSGSLWWGFFGAKTNGNPRFVKHKQLRSSGKSTQNKTNHHYYCYFYCNEVGSTACRLGLIYILTLNPWKTMVWTIGAASDTMKTCLDFVRLHQHGMHTWYIYRRGFAHPFKRGLSRHFVCFSAKTIHKFFFLTSTRTENIALKF